LKEKLKKFKIYAGSLLPFETEYLYDKLNSTDREKSEILKLVRDNSLKIDDNYPYDTSIDKRKYSNLMKWMQSQLGRIDIDKQLDWITKVQKAILLDAIDSAQESAIMKSLDSMDPSKYYFINYFEMLKDYRHYLLIRMRYLDHSRIDAFIEKYKFNYQRSRLVNDQMHQATVDIIGAEDRNAKSATQWEKWMNECFEDDSLDGMNRYMSLIRLNFIYSRYNLLDKLEVLFQKANSLFRNGTYYSRRLLLNFYDNLVVFYDKKSDYTKARYYGYLSIRDFNPDSIIYINNLVNVLIKMCNYTEALSVMENVNFKIRESQNFHSMVGFVSNYIRVLSKTDRTREAILKGRVFLDAYSKQILKYRWYRFFSAYLGALLIDQKYNELLKLISRYKLVERESSFYTEKRSARVITIYYTVALFYKSEIDQADFNGRISELLSDNHGEGYLDSELVSLLESLSTET